MIDWIKSLFFKREPRPETISIENFVVSLEYEIKDLHSMIDMHFEYLEAAEKGQHASVPWDDEDQMETIRMIDKYRIGVLTEVDRLTDQIRFNHHLIHLIKK